MQTIIFSKQAHRDIAQIIKIQQQNYDIIASNPVGESNQIQNLKKRAELLPQKIEEYMKKKIIPYKVLGEIRETHMKHNSLQNIYIQYAENQKTKERILTCVFIENFL